jgi:uncharacterized membrane protein YdbT with pleckstrin-like domain
MAAPGSSSEAEETLFDGHPAAVPSFGALLVSVLTAGLGFLYFFVQSRATHYKVTTRRVLAERGLLSKRMEQVDAYRIKDFVVERPFGQRLLGTGNLLLHTMDATAPTLELRGLATDVVALYERLRAATEADRARRGVRLLDNE